MKQRESPDRGQQTEAQEKAQQGQGPELPARSFDRSSQHDIVRQMKLIVGFSRANLDRSRHSAFSLYVCLGSATEPTPIDHSAVLPSAVTVLETLFLAWIVWMLMNSVHPVKLRRSTSKSPARETNCVPSRSDAFRINAWGALSIDKRGCA